MVIFYTAFAFEINFIYFKIKNLNDLKYTLLIISVILTILTSIFNTERGEKKGSLKKISKWGIFILILSVFSGFGALFLTISEDKEKEEEKKNAVQKALSDSIANSKIIYNLESNLKKSDLLISTLKGETQKIDSNFYKQMLATVKQQYPITSLYVYNFILFFDIHENNMQNFGRKLAGKYDALIDDDHTRFEITDQKLLSDPDNKLSRLTNIRLYGSIYDNNNGIYFFHDTYRNRPENDSDIVKRKQEYEQNVYRSGAAEFMESLNNKISFIYDSKDRSIWMVITMAPIKSNPSIKPGYTTIPDLLNKPVKLEFGFLDTQDGSPVDIKNYIFKHVSFSLSSKEITIDFDNLKRSPDDDNYAVYRGKAIGTMAGVPYK